MPEVNEHDVLRRAQAQTLLKIGELVYPWITPNSLNRSSGIDQLVIKNSNVQSTNARITIENNKIVVEILPRQRIPNDEVAVIPSGEQMTMSLTGSEEVEEPPDGPTERQDGLEEA